MKKEIKKIIIKLNLMIEDLEQNCNKSIYCSKNTLSEIIKCLEIFTQPYDDLIGDEKEIFEWFYRQKKEEEKNISYVNFSTNMIEKICNVIFSVAMHDDIDKKYLVTFILNKATLDYKSDEYDGIYKTNIYLNSIYERLFGTNIENSDDSDKDKQLIKK